MKDFVKMTLAVVCGIILVGILCLILGLGLLGSAVAAGSGKPALPKSGVLRIDLSKIRFSEQTQESSPFGNFDPTSLLTGSGTPSGSVIGIWDAVQALDAAAADPAVKYIYLRTDGNVSDVTALGEIRTALSRFRASGKPVITYMETPGTGSYYLASVSDKIYMTPSLGASSQFIGVGSQMFFLGDLLKRLGVNVQLIRHGKYKSAGEMYTRGSASPENREQYQRMVDSMWESIGGEIAEARGISLQELDADIEGLRLNLPQDFVDCKLVDELLDRQALQDKLATLAVVDKYKDIKWIGFADYVSAKLLPSKVRQKIAVIYADGEIIDGSGRSEVAGDRFASVIAKVAADSSVKAVVLRVNSPGGSVLASEKIKAELDRLRDSKPLVASYGSYAASGGYWISTCCDKIFSGATTLTGSIGVFGMVPDLSKVAKDIAHVGVESITSHKHGDMYGLMRPFDEDEYAYMLASIEAVYDRFTTIVSEGRDMPKDDVDAIGQGRVWTGADALGINLVDEIGTLEDAIRFAAVAAGEPDLTKWNVKGYPAPPGAMDQVLDMLGQGPDPDGALVSSIRRLTRPQVLARMDVDIRIQ
ncbi:MAG: signal peptide peptidase SppA [Bacteroidales bacterium]|jgi:protease-4|nr:signal peptide peptidase SppA [Bacteroidales bacterium]